MEPKTHLLVVFKPVHTDILMVLWLQLQIKLPPALRCDRRLAHKVDTNEKDRLPRHVTRFSISRPLESHDVRVHQCGCTKGASRESSSRITDSNAAACLALLH